MPLSIKQITDLIEEGQGLKGLTGAFADIASIKLRKIKSRVERNREFFDEISELYILIRKEASKRDAFLKKNGRTISLVITSNKSFYGKLNTDLIDFYIKSYSNLESDIIVIGQTGVQLLHAMSFLSHPFKKPFDSLIWKDDLPNFQELMSLVLKIRDYSKILVFYPQLKTLLEQAPSIKDITYSESPRLPLDENIFIFEPEIFKILTFFDSQITLLLLDYTLLEAELSRIAARLISMNEARNNAENFIKQQKRSLYTLEKSVENSQVLETAFVIESLNQKM